MKKKMSDYSHEELLKLSTKELSELFDLERENRYEKSLSSGEEKYLNYTFQEKVSFWSGELHQSMRWSVEDGEDPYSIYTLEWYKSTKEFEPDFDKIMDEVFEKKWGTGADWSKEEYLKRIGKLPPPS